MGEKIPDEVVERVRQSVDIVDVISEYVQLKKQGRNYFGLCPFHGESTPSFSVSSDKQIFHCFGCGEGGNALSFLMKIEGISFSEAVQKVGEKVGVNVAGYVGEPQVVDNAEGRMVEAHELLKKYYHHLLLNSQEGQIALEYLLKRGISKDLISKFELGYAGPAWDHGAKVLQKRGFSLVNMEKAGLVIENEQGEGYRDRFRHRVMFPIHNAQGKTIAFSGRTLGDDAPKYLNSPETPIFHKSNVLYHFHQARTSMRKQQRALLFEGYADVIAAVGIGLEESVATMGTAITKEQALLLKRHAQNVVICYDGDKAGQEATAKAGVMLLEAGCNVKTVIIPDRMDPDEYIRTHGASSFRKLVEESLTFIDFKLHYLRFGKNLQNPQEQGKYVQAVVQELAKLTTFVQAQPYLQALAKEFPYEMEDLRNELRKLQKGRMQTDSVVPVRRQLTKPRFKGYERAERELVYHALHSEEVAQRLQPYIQDFYTEEHKGILYELYAYYEKGYEASVSKFLDWLSNETLKKIATDISTDELINPSYSQELFEGDLKSLQNHKQKIEEMSYAFEVRKIEKVDPKAAAQFALENIINKRKARR
ncbi:DNA primase [Ectobacillus antri]|jgi:DNA primase|uniref:DNA primase n=1 Tax=Ectobacillus antri TaxID=2486280 RepID=A0ABT6H3Q9_9BACI|nr:DNA primase [Ectobacillus antri]MDG4655502.1 DNA primase [Ectobacillus antri]MDG5753260.1 DNA primase [Ectobacillus antri]